VGPIQHPIQSSLWAVTQEVKGPLREADHSPAMARFKYGKDYLLAWRGKVYLLLIFTLL